MRHKEQWCQAEHLPIIDRTLWKSVHAILASNYRVRGDATRPTTPLLLKGIVFGNDGRVLTPWHSTKRETGKRYVGRPLNLTTLAPDIVDAILLDVMPDHLAPIDLGISTPLHWEEQRERVYGQLPKVK